MWDTGERRSPILSDIDLTVALLNTQHPHSAEALKHNLRVAWQTGDHAGMHIGSGEQQDCPYNDDQLVRAWTLGLNGFPLRDAERIADEQQG